MTLRNLTDSDIKRLQVQESNDWENYLEQRVSKEDRQFLKYDKRVRAAVKAAFSNGLKAYLATQTTPLA